MKADLEDADLTVVPDDDRGDLASSWSPVLPARPPLGAVAGRRTPTPAGTPAISSSSTPSVENHQPMGTADSALEWLRHLADGDRLTLLDDDALLAELRVLEEVGRLADAGRMFAAGLVAQRSDTSKGSQRLCAREGFTKPEDMIAQVTGTSTRTVRERIRQAEPLQYTQVAVDLPESSQLDTTQAVPFPLLRRAIREGFISPDAASVITAALGPARKSGIPVLRIGEAERALLVAAMGADAVTTGAHAFGEAADALLTEVRRSGTQPGAMALTQLARLARSWSRMLSQESDPGGGGENSRAERQRHDARRFLTIHTLRDGTRRLEGELLPEAAAQLERLLDAHLNPRTETPAHSLRDPSTPGHAAAGEAHGHHPDFPPDTGTAVGADSVAASGAAAGFGALAGSGAAAGSDPAAGPRSSAGLVPAEDGRAASAPDLDPRTPRQKRHDALAGILATAAGVPEMPLLGGAAPTLVVTTTADQLGRPTGTAFLQGTHDEADSAVDISVAHHIGCVGAVQKVVTDSRGRIVELMAPQRIFTAHQRRAIATRDGGCVIPGCSVPVTWCEIHHVREWHQGGETHTDNGVALCWHHHRSLDQLGWDIQMREGVPWVRPPSTIDRRRRWFRAQSGLHQMFRELTDERAVSDPADSRDDRTRSPGAPTARDAHPPPRGHSPPATVLRPAGSNPREAGAHSGHPPGGGPGRHDEDAPGSQQEQDVLFALSG